MNGRIELVKEWIEYADHDLATAKLVIDQLPEFREIVGFHSQQATEKYVKAYLIYLDIPFKKSHSILYLIDILGDANLELHWISKAKIIDSASI